MMNTFGKQRSKSMRRGFLAGIVAIIFVVSGASQILAAETAAEDPTGAEEFVRQLAEHALSILNDTTLTQNERDEAFRGILKQGFALDYVSRLVLGRHGRTASRTQLAEYNRIFPEYILRIYSSRLTEYGDEEFVVDGTAPAGKRDIYVRVKIMRPDGPPLAGDWRVRKLKGNFKVIDIKIEGISMVVTQRDEFLAKIASSGLDSLIADLKRQAKLDTAQATKSAFE
jgi:phospholipid transport system substrate-binding protein